MTPEILKNVLAVGLGSALGGIARYGIALALKNLCVAFPWGTLCVNALGCFLLGLLWGWFGRHGGADGTWALLLTVGFCALPRGERRRRTCSDATGLFACEIVSGGIPASPLHVEHRSGGL